MSIGKRIKSVRGKMSREEFAKSINIHPQSLYRYEQDLHKIDLAAIISICDKLNISSEWLIFGRGPMKMEQEISQIEKEQESTIKIDEPSGILPANKADIECDVDLIMVPMVEARLSAGSGSLETSGNVEGMYAFRSDFLRRKGNPNEMVLMRVGGDSMAPEILDGDVVLVDQGKRYLRPGPIFAVCFEDAIYLKRIDKLPGKIILKSANQAYAPVELDVEGQNEDSFRVIGQVVWSGREY